MFIRTYLSDDFTNWFDNASCLDSAIGDAGQQRSEGKIVSRGDNLNFERGIFQAFEEACPSPTSSQNNHFLLLHISIASVGERASHRAVVGES